MIQNIIISQKILMTKMNIKKYLIYFVAVDGVLAIFSSFKGSSFLLSSQTGFISSVLVTLSSYQSYKKMIEYKISIGDIPKEEKDELEKIDDKFDLYSEDEESDDFKSIVEQEKKNIKGFKTSAKNLKKSIFAFISPLRLGSYLFLIMSFLYLNTHHLLNIFAFILGISVVSLVTLVVGFLKPTTNF